MDALLGRDRSDGVHASMWASPDRGLWVAAADGLYQGLVERVGAVFRATDGRGTPVGDFDTLGGAQRALHAHHAIDLSERYSRGIAR